MIEVGQVYYDVIEEELLKIERIVDDIIFFSRTTSGFTYLDIHHMKKEIKLGLLILQNNENKQ